MRVKDFVSLVSDVLRDQLPPDPDVSLTEEDVEDVLAQMNQSFQRSLVVARVENGEFVESDALGGVPFYMRN